MHFPTKAIGRANTLTTPVEKRIRYKFYLEFKVIRLNNLKGVSLEVMGVVGKCFVLPEETIKFCRAQWSHHTEEEDTWKHGENLGGISPIPILLAFSKLKGELHLKGVNP
jgi:hypothetical protein